MHLLNYFEHRNLTAQNLVPFTTPRQARTYKNRNGRGAAAETCFSMRENSEHCIRTIHIPHTQQGTHTTFATCSLIPGPFERTFYFREQTFKRPLHMRQTMHLTENRNSSTFMGVWPALAHLHSHGTRATEKNDHTRDRHQTTTRTRCHKDVLADFFRIHHHPIESRCAPLHRPTTRFPRSPNVSMLRQRACTTGPALHALFEATPRMFWLAPHFLP